MAALMGMKEIQKHVNLSESTVLIWIREVGLPAKKVGGIWISDTEAIDRWLLTLVESTAPDEASPSSPPPLPLKTNNDNKTSRRKKT